MMAAPLIAGNDVRSMMDSSRAAERDHGCWHLSSGFMLHP